MAFITVEQFVEALEHWNVLEINQAIKAIEKKFDIKPTVIISNVQQEKTKTEEEKTFSISIKEIGSNKIPIIKLCREIFNWGLKEAKDKVENTLKPLAENLDKQEVEKLKKELEACGATVEVK